MEQENIILEPKVIYHLKKRVISMRMAICDDDKKLIQDMRPHIFEYANKRRLDLIVDQFFSGEELLASTTKYDVIILDFQMDGMDGLDTARTLRTRNNNCAIIFLTSFPHFVYEAFEVNTFRFFEKPLNYDKLFSALDDYFEMYGNDYPILLQCNRENININTNEIVFLEAMNKNCLIHLEKETLQCAKTMAIVRKQLPKLHFYKVNRAFIINFNFIAKYDNDNIILKNGDEVHISRNYLTSFKNAYRNYSDLKNPRRLEQRSEQWDR
ncbi:MAG: LytTR family DNA-binding domain-containing protein [Holosporaceae bacterium]|jgi:DNA-binding LytR/AlgR family response regulator|nr:LytTR family DNA-binding domain-containing protein [Holosporaceae bacterium]